MQTLRSINSIVEQIEFRDWHLHLICHNSYFYIQWSWEDIDCNTGKMSIQKSRKWLISKYMTDSEIVQTVFKAAATAMEHEVREWFKFQTYPVMRPHYDVYELVNLCRKNAVSKREESIYEKDNLTSGFDSWYPDK